MVLGEICSFKTRKVSNELSVEEAGSVERTKAITVLCKVETPRKIAGPLYMQMAGNN